MYIKQIIIQGFKSYKSQTVIEPFSPKHNVIVGRNGSGKSNFFAAIRFVLGDAYTQMGREERQALLHEGSGSAVMSAYVEIIFDNTDRRFPTDREELILRRTIGMKKDEYSLDRKTATKADVMNLFESAGFSRANPYYIVPQGRVTALTNMKDAERLILLKEVAGTQVYEARRSESIKIMGETDAKRSKIDELLSYIRERLDELEEEKEELRAFQEQDKERRCLEYTLYNREYEEASRQLEELEERRNLGADEAEDARDHFIDGEKELAHIDDRLDRLRQEVDLLNVERKQFEDEQRELAKQKAQVELELETSTQSQRSVEDATMRRREEQRQVEGLIREKENQLDLLVPEYNRAAEEEKTIKSKLDDAQETVSSLYGKQGRSARYKSKNERDRWLQQQIEEVNTALAMRKAVVMQNAEEINQLEAQVKQAEIDASELQKRLEEREGNDQAMSTDIQSAKLVRDRLMDERKTLWREEAQLDSVIRNSQQDLEKAERFLSSMMAHNTSRGIASVRRIRRNYNMQGVYGTLAELFTVPDAYKTAAEVTAGESLFHYVVDNESTATKLTEILNREKAGRVTFMPLNRLRTRDTNLPKAMDAVPLINKLTFDTQFERAFQQVFGNTIVCPNLQVAAQYARSHGVTAITPDGDRSDKKGALTGGFHDPRRSRLDAMQAVGKARDEVESKRARSLTITKELQVKDQEITKAISDLQKLDQHRQQFENGYSSLLQSLRNKQQIAQEQQDIVEVRKRSNENVEAAVRSLASQQQSYEAELASEFKKNLSKSEEQQLESLSAVIPKLRKQFLELSNARTEREAEKSALESELKDNLRPRFQQLQNQAREEIGSRAKTNVAVLKERASDLRRIAAAIKTTAAQLQKLDVSSETSNTQLNKLTQERISKMAEQDETARLIERLQRRSEKSHARRTNLREKAAEAQQHIRSLGTLPQDAFEGKFSRISGDKAEKRLRQVKESLKQYSHVNKKAFEQYSNFTRQKETLMNRREELDTSQKSIRELIETLDQRKDEAIERTFKQVSREFALIFERLVPAGRGRLVIQRKTDKRTASADNEEDEDEEQQRTRESIENYTGVGIAVSFNSKHDEQQRIAQLSGGQKSLCALALIFAIQQCDPAPFYLFDEIDANLDAQYRTAVARLLQDLSSGRYDSSGHSIQTRASGEEGEEPGEAQFICTTFRSEMVLVAEKCYGVAYSNKTSSIDVVDKDEALQFVEGQISGT